MKKLKFLQSALMLIMCVGVLAVGVFAISPIISTIGVTLSISAAQGVKVAVYNNKNTNQKICCSFLMSKLLCEMLQYSYNFNKCR